MCFSVAVPSSSASAGSGNIYFQIKAPTSMQWVSLGTGSHMGDSYMFVMYQDGNGNVTVSPRQGTGHTAPELDTSDMAAKLTLLAGSGVSNDGQTMTANVACANCETWQDGGKMSLTDTKSHWIAAWNSGPSFATTSQGKELTYHEGYVHFRVDLTKAAVVSDSNPFMQQHGGSGSKTPPGSGLSDGDARSGSPDSGATTVSDEGGYKAIMVAHGVGMTIVMVVLYPLGSLIMPVLGRWLAHGAFQMVGFVLMWASFGVGVHYALKGNVVSILPRHKSRYE